MGRFSSWAGVGSARPLSRPCPTTDMKLPWYRSRAELMSFGPVAVDLCGPDELTLWEMTMALPSRPRLPLSVPIGKAFTGGTLISESCQVIGPRFGEWLKKAPRS